MPKRFTPPSDEVCSILQDRLYDFLSLAGDAKQAHWTVTGVNFLTLHEFFDRIFSELMDYADEIAERIVTLGSQVMGTVKCVAKGSHLPEYPTKISKGEQHIEAFSKSLFQLKMIMRANVHTVSELEDNGSADLLSDLSRKIDQLCWMVGSQIEAK